MQQRKLGKSNLEVSAIGLGCMGMSFSYGSPKDKQEMSSLLRAALGGGGTIRAVFADADYVKRMEPAEILSRLWTLK